MMFWFKTKEIVIDCFTHHHGVYELYKPLNANKFIPDGWKTLPKKFDVKVFPGENDSNLTVEKNTVKTCAGFINLFRRGFIIQNHVETYLEIKRDGSLNGSASDGGVVNVVQHPMFGELLYQTWQGFYENYGHAKLTTPWFFVEKTGVNFIMTKCTWNNTEIADNFHVLNGVLDFKFQHNAAINFYVKRNSVLTLSAGQPLAHIIPLSENTIKLKHHLISKEEFNNRFRFIPANKLYQELKRVKNNF